MAEINADFFKKKIGPFPAFVWIIGVLALVYVYYRYTANSAAGQSSTGVAGNPGRSVGAGSNSGNYYGVFHVYLHRGKVPHAKPKPRKKPKPKPRQLPVQHKPVARVRAARFAAHGERNL